MLGRRVSFFLSAFGLWGVASPTAAAQTPFPPVRLTLQDVAFQDGALTLCLETDPPVDPPLDNPSNGALEFTWQVQTDVGTWQDAPSPPQTNGWEGFGVGRKLTVRTKLQEPFEGRLCVRAKKTGYSDSESVYVRLFAGAKAVKVVLPPGQAGIASVGPDDIELPSGVPSTFSLLVSHVATGDPLVQENGRYHLQIEGPGAAAFSFEDGQAARTVEFVDGEATFQLTGRAGSQPAWLVGFDVDRGPDAPDALAPLRLRLKVR